MKIRVRLVGGPFDRELVDVEVEETDFFVKAIETVGPLAGRLQDYYMGEVDYTASEQIALYSAPADGAS